MAEERSPRSFFLRRLPLEHETAIYLLVSSLDVFMTYLLLRNDHTEEDVWFFESNPVARYFLYHWGPRGMIYFKFVMVGVVCLIAQVIAARRIRVARRLLWFATLVVAGVVIYSFG